MTALDHTLHVSRAPMAQRHPPSSSALQEAATRSQGPILRDLAARRAAGPVRNFKAYWLVNAVKVGHDRRLRARTLARRSDVDTWIEPNPRSS